MNASVARVAVVDPVRAGRGASRRQAAARRAALALVVRVAGFLLLL
ncbi:MAG: hypothetical protein QOG11_1906, partial [Solirubrobacteraceae bacterium]|nr:hypothetical protein [Solirubrobacteraceae bacterium]